ncbi:MAG: hypothetical protein U0869_00605 [Chloroflexota bacterium]
MTRIRPHRSLLLAPLAVLAMPVGALAQGSASPDPAADPWPQAGVYLHVGVHLFGPGSTTLVHLDPDTTDRPAVCVSILESVLRGGPQDFEASLEPADGSAAMALRPVLETLGAPDPDRLLANTACLPTRADLGGPPAGHPVQPGDTVVVRYGTMFNGGSGDRTTELRIPVPASSLTYQDGTLGGALGITDGASWVTAWAGADLVEDDDSFPVVVKRSVSDTTAALADGSLDAPGVLWVAGQLSPGVWVDQVLAGDVGCDAVVVEASIDRAPACVRRGGHAAG